MSKSIPTSGLFEAHLVTHDLDRSVAFYRDVVGLQLGRHDPEDGTAFLWVGAPGHSMLGLWAAGPAPMTVSLHIAFTASIADVQQAPARLRELGVTPLSFDLAETHEPSVIGWMPAVAVYFRDPDGHLLEYLAMLDMPADPNRGVVGWSEWDAVVER